jgi:hypothetical protein
MCGTLNFHKSWLLQGLAKPSSICKWADTLLSLKSISTWGHYYSYCWPFSCSLSHCSIYTSPISLSLFFHKNQNRKRSMAYQNPLLKSCMVACYMIIFARDMQLYIFFKKFKTMVTVIVLENYFPTFNIFVLYNGKTF